MSSRLRPEQIIALQDAFRLGLRPPRAGLRANCTAETARAYYLEFAAQGIKHAPREPRAKPLRRLSAYGGPNMIGQARGPAPVRKGPDWIGTPAANK